MSHFSQLKVQLKDMKLAMELAAKRGWNVTHEEVFKNPYAAANESVEDCHVFRQGSSPKLVRDKRGNVIHDTWSMGRDAYGFMQDYSEAFIRKTAASEGAMVSNMGVDANGNRVLEIQYAY